MSDVKFIAGIRTDAINRSGTVPIVIKVYLNNKEVAHPSLKKRILPEDWDEQKRQVKTSNPNHKLLNGILKNKINLHENFVLKRQALGLPVNKDILLKYIKSEGGIDVFSQVAEDVISTKKLKDGKCLNEDTKRRYRDEIKRLESYRPGLTFNQLTPKFLTDYKLHLQNDYVRDNGQKLHKNSIWKAMGVIRMVYNEAVDKEIITGENNPFKTFDVGSYEQDMHKIKYLELDQLEKLESALNNEEMEEMTFRVGWRFLSMCVCGMRISDAMRLDELYFNDAGDLEYKPHKTRRHDNIAQVPLTTNRQRRYIEQTLSLPLPQTDPKSFRTTFNIHLKILAAMAKININLTSHVGRHSMGSFLVDAGVEGKAFKAIMGIKSNKVMETYAHLKQSKLKSEADKLGNVF